MKNTVVRVRRAINKKTICSQSGLMFPNKKLDNFARLELVLYKKKILPWFIFIARFVVQSHQIVIVIDWCQFANSTKI